MPFPVHCTTCGRQYRLPDTRRGSQVRCPGCGASFLADPTTEDELPDVVPAGVAGAETGSATGLARVPGPAPTRPRPARRADPGRTTARSSSLFPMLVVGAGFLIVFLTLAAGLLVIALSVGVGLLSRPVAGPVPAPPGERAAPEAPAPAAPQPPAQEPRANGPWHVAPDPLPDPIKGPFNLNASLPLAFMGPTVAPSTPGPFLAVTPAGVRDMSRIQVVDLRTIQPVGPGIQGNFFGLKTYDHPALSPDGVYFAARVKGAGKPTVEVWSVATGQSVQRLEVDQDPRIFAGRIDFAGPDRLFVTKHEGQFPDPAQRATYQVWDIKAGKPVVEFAYDLVFDWRWAGFSPGRRYLVMEQTNGERGYHLLFWDLSTGKQVGDFEFQDRGQQWGQASGIVFSPDGTELAMLWRLGNRPNTWGRLLSWDVRTGKKLFDHNVAYEPPQIDSLWFDGGTRSLTWCPDRGGWVLFGHLLVDRESGAVVWKLPPAPVTNQAIVPRVFLDTDHVSTVEGQFDKKLAVLTLPRAQIDAAVKAARGGK